MSKLILTAFAFMLAGAAAARADPICGVRHDLLAELAEQYKETPVGTGLASNGGLIELLASTTGTTWTLIITAPNGPSCIVATGEDWEPAKPAAPGGKGI